MTGKPRVPLDPERRASYIALWIFSLAFGWTEAATVVYLRWPSPSTGISAVGVQFPLVLISGQLVASEIVRETCTMLVLGAAAWLAARSWADRVGAFLLAFGVWDLFYYLVLRLISGWPNALTNWDLLFLIPLPWVAPVWAPATIAAIFVSAGSYLYWTAERARQYTLSDFAILIASAVAVVASFIVDWRVALASEVPQRFPQWLYWAGVLVGTAWFVRVERRGVLR